MAGPSKRYLICTSPRSGSTYLCHLLSRTGTLGMQPYDTRRFEYFLRYFQKNLGGADWPRTSAPQLFDFCFAESATPNGVMGFKVMWDHFDRVIGKARRSGQHRGMGRSGVERELAASMQFVWLRRRDEIRQAISWTKALQSNGWNIESQRFYQGAYVYDFPGICLARWRIRSADAGWSGFFERCKIRPLTLYYEDYLADLPSAFRAIANLLGLPEPESVDTETPRLQVQADSINDDWENRYRTDSSGAFAGMRAVTKALTSGEWWAAYWRRIQPRSRE